MAVGSPQRGCGAGLTPLPARQPCRRAFYDKRVSQEVDGEALGEVRPPAAGTLAAVCCCAAVCELRSFRWLRCSSAAWRTSNQHSSLAGAQPEREVLAAGQGAAAVRPGDK